MSKNSASYLPTPHKQKKEGNHIAASKVLEAGIEGRNAVASSRGHLLAQTAGRAINISEVRATAFQVSIAARVNG